jgi:hypothetical protein
MAMFKRTAVETAPEDKNLKALDDQLARLAGQREALAEQAGALWDDYQGRLVELGPRPAIEKLAALDALDEQVRQARRELGALDAEIARLTRAREIMAVAVVAERVAVDGEAYRKAVQEVWDAIQTLGAAAARARTIAGSIEAQLGDVPVSAALGFSRDALSICDEFRSVTELAHGGPWKAWRDRAIGFGLIDGPTPQPATETPTTAALMRRARSDDNAAAALDKWTAADEAKWEQDPMTGRVRRRGAQ